MFGVQDAAIGIHLPIYAGALIRDNIETGVIKHLSDYYSNKSRKISSHPQPENKAPGDFQANYGIWIQLSTFFGKTILFPDLIRLARASSNKLNICYINILDPAMKMARNLLNL